MNVETLNFPQDENRPTLFTLWKEIHFNTCAVANATGVAEAAIVLMLRNQPIARTEAETVLTFLSEHYQRNLTLDTVRLKTFGERTL